MRWHRSDQGYRRVERGSTDAAQRAQAPPSATVALPAANGDVIR
ncbi:MAG TPA: hypothetical protein VMR54_13515 [Thermoanaerobaculia bacterium]|nr:hypothetical protein [Thermoanaerobaculia bacterium]